MNCISIYEEEIKLIKSNTNYHGKVSVNLRSSSPKPMIEISKIKELDIIEINAHCRQPELIESGCGQALLKNPENLYDFVSRSCKKHVIRKVSVKIRANVSGVDDITSCKSCK